MTDLLTKDELHWLDEYHARVLSEIGPMLDGETLAWLENGDSARFPTITSRIEALKTEPMLIR